MDAEEGYGWTFTFADRVSREYRRFLVLCLEHRKDSKYLIVPSKLVDKFWHLHILDTRKYIEDCQYCFGSMLHHFPYFGMRGDEDAVNLREAWLETLALYQSAFDVEPPAEIWPHSKSHIATRYQGVAEKDAKAAHGRFDCRRPRLADLERLNGTSHSLRRLKIGHGRRYLGWKGLTALSSLIGVSVFFLDAYFLSGSAKAYNNTMDAISTLIGFTIISGFLLLIGILLVTLFAAVCFTSTFYDSRFLIPFFVTIYTKIETI
ncbi:glycine-rich domain-containing protein [Candidatus Synechococcus spongiarum]|uniref:glycine-rich domain-containing protein n=1 Tax=Candidatus Synechococcus spongiarum TaxID=431041 RepID=UPI001378E7F1|nr:hypothetical protein [Candidatus Synechococcus spongiarum]